MVTIDGKKLAIDTMILVYLLEDQEKLGIIAEKILEKGEAIIASILSHLEVAVGFYKDDDILSLNNLTVLPETFHNFDFINVDMSISLEAARLRARYTSLKTPDSIHLATAITKKADYFITDDKRLKKITEIPVLTIDEIKIKD